MELKFIIERLEKAAAPDRELDREIYSAVNNVPLENCGDGSEFTRSVDAALKLLPEGTGVGFDILGKGNSWGRGNIKVRAWANQSEDQWTYPGWDGVEGATPAIAVCIAALSARVALGGDK